jgi:hypothetical protein
MATSDEIRQMTERALSVPGKDIPLELFVAVAAHAGAMVARQTADDAVRDAEAHLVNARASAQPTLIEGATSGLQLARTEQRTAAMVERLYEGSVKAIEARIELIAASWRRERTNG